MRGRIQATKPSKSGKTLGVQIDGTWYTTKLWELQQHVGKEIVGETEHSEDPKFDITWLNSYSLVDGNVASGTATPLPQQVAAAVAAQEQAYQGSKKPPEKPQSHYQPMVSNLCAALIAAGKQPTDLRPWFNEAVDVLENPYVIDDPVPF